MDGVNKGLLGANAATQVIYYLATYSRYTYTRTHISSFEFISIIIVGIRHTIIRFR